MTGDELDRLADLIARTIERTLERRGAPSDSRRQPGASWVPAPVRPEPPTRGGDPAPWTGAGQALGDVAPIRDPLAPRHRPDARELVAAVRAAAAGKGTPPEHAATGRTIPAPRRRGRALPITVRIGVSNRHVHLSPAHVEALVGAPGLTADRALLQPGQFAAKETLTVVGPAGRLENVRIVGPARGETQVELAPSDAARLGIEPPLAASGSLASSTGGVTLVGARGRVELQRGVIVAARHLHCATDDAARWGFRDGDRVDVVCGTGARAVTFHDVLVRAGPGHATELHLDRDEALAAGVRTGDTARIVGWREPVPRRRPLITERDVTRIAARRDRLPPDAILTPSARDRARALGLVDP